MRLRLAGLVVIALGFVAVPARRTSDGRLVLVDTGWPNSGHQYWKNIDQMGFDLTPASAIVVAPDGPVFEPAGP